ncbi:MerR family transcriptional regulator [Streptomyces sp. A1136]|uniref:MerR family transcriptional regulator n=1 Tax=Streptomyces sp. A1136 TaxID=2563102 RepID=UPI0026B28CDB|nr:MerR family transcriptional regulator [Streptomyces sp. A1136]
MRIGELAEIVGLTTRAVRHYHRVGLLPEPPRRPNGYREYTLRDAVRLARVRRLTELGLRLDDVKDVLADDAGKGLVDILTELDADLGRQEEDIRQRRVRLGRLLDQAERTGRLPVEAPVSPELAAFFDDMARAAARLPGPEPAATATGSPRWGAAWAPTPRPCGACTRCTPGWTRRPGRTRRIHGWSRPPGPSSRASRTRWCGR